MSAELVLRWSIGFLLVWGAAVTVYAFWNAGKPAWNPLPPEPIELHHGHGHDHGHDDHDHGHAGSGGDAHGH